MKKSNSIQSDNVLITLLLAFTVSLLCFIISGCQTKDYTEKLASLYNHTVPLITSKELSEELKKDSTLVLLDIRSPAEFAVSRIPAAQPIVYNNFAERDIADIPKKSSIVLYCSVGYRSEKIGEKLLDLGYKNVRNLYGGIFQWKNEGFDVVNSNGQPTDSVHTYNKSWSVWLTNGVKVY